MDDSGDLKLLRSLQLRGFTVIAVLGILVAIAAGLFVHKVVIDGIARVVQSGVGGFVSEAYTPADVSSISPTAAAKLESLVRKRIDQGVLSYVAVVRNDGTVLYQSSQNMPQLPPADAITQALAGTVRSDVVLDRGSSTLRVIGPAELPPGSPTAVWIGWRPYAPVAGNVQLATGAVAIIVLLGVSMAIVFLAIFTRQAQQQMRRQVEQRVQTERRLTAALADLESASLGTLISLLMAVDARDHYTAMHSSRVADYAKAIATEMGLTDSLQLFERAGLLHDVGKIGTAEALLQKTGPLTAEELKEVSAHPVTGARIIESIPFLSDVAPVVRAHHERWDGSGYPDGLSGEQIPLAARILAVANVFDTKTTSRASRKAMDEASARAEMARARGTQFDPSVVDALLDGLESGRIRVLAAAPGRRSERDAPASGRSQR